MYPVQQALQMDVILVPDAQRQIVFALKNLLILENYQKDTMLLAILFNINRVDKFTQNCKMQKLFKNYTLNSA